MKPAPALQVYVTPADRQRVRVAAAHRGQTMSDFCRATILAEVGRVEAEVARVEADGDDDK